MVCQNFVHQLVLYWRNCGITSSNSGCIVPLESTHRIWDGAIKGDLRETSREVIAGDLLLLSCGIWCSCFTVVTEKLVCLRLIYDNSTWDSKLASKVPMYLDGDSIYPVQYWQHAWWSPNALNGSPSNRVDSNTTRRKFLVVPWKVCGWPFLMEVSKEVGRFCPCESKSIPTGWSKKALSMGWV